MADKLTVKTPKIRKNWGGVKPVTRVETVQTDYNRADFKKGIQDALEEELEDDELSSF